MPDLCYELELKDQGYQNICGVDEVGRGPWAGPVTAAAVILPPRTIDNAFALNEIAKTANDSKKLSAKTRQNLFELIQSTCVFALGEASVEEIDTHNIREATFLAMNRAVANLPTAADYALIDGNAVPTGFPLPNQTIIKGDSVSLSIACASIIAKVTRDAYMEKLHQQFPHFAWNTNAGYGTKAHQKGMLEHGITPHHRRSFAPIKTYIT